MTPALGSCLNLGICGNQFLVYVVRIDPILISVEYETIAY